MRISATFIVLLTLISSYFISRCLANAAVLGTAQLSVAKDDPTARGKPTAFTGAGSNLSASASPMNSTPHSVKLVWKPSIPASKSQRDAIIGYIVYRSLKAHDRQALPINTTRVGGTTFIDSDVESGKIYYYVTRAVSASGRLSDPSNEVRVEIPH